VKYWTKLNTKHLVICLILAESDVDLNT